MDPVDHQFLFEYLNEFAFWYQNMASQSGLPRALSGINKSGGQFVVRLDGVVLTHEERHGLISIILEQEGASCYAYGGMLRPEGEDEDRLILIVASHDYYLMSSFTVDQDKATLHQRELWEGDNPQDIPGAWFLTGSIQVSDADRTRYQLIWQDLRQQAMFLQRPE
jgi:hypothetical protein